jgi:hypothetical protein
MIELSPATQDEMILAFLRAEIHSSRYRQFVSQGLAHLGFQRCLIDLPNLSDANQNHARRLVLQQYRGWPKTRLFREFPADATWRRVILEAQDFQDMRYMNDARIEGHWTNLSDGTRLVSVASRNLLKGRAEAALQHVAAIAESLRNSFPFLEPLILAELEGESPLVLVEGHSRATAYVIENRIHNVEAFVASSKFMNRWYFY